METLCATAAGGYRHAEDPKERREVVVELVERLPELRQTLCSTVAGGCGRAEALEELFEVLFETVAWLRELFEVLYAIMSRRRIIFTIRPTATNSPTRLIRNGRGRFHTRF